MERPLRTQDTQAWADRRTGPPEARIRPRSPALRRCFALADRLPKPYSAYLRAAGVRTLSSAPVVLDTAWGELRAPRRDHMFFRPVFDEPLETAVMVRVLAPGMRAVDVGANRGWFTLLMARCVGADGSVLAFEPDPAPRSQLEANIAANRLTNVVLETCALAETPGTARFVTTEESALSHLAREEDAGRDDGFEVQVERLDDVLARHGDPPVDVVKIDVEGAELRVLAGAPRLLARADAPVLLVEIEEEHQRQYGARADDVVDLLGPGYASFRLCWRHGRAEPFPAAACSSGRNLLCIPTARVDDVLSRVFAR